MEINTLISELIVYAECHLNLKNTDKPFLFNALCELFLVDCPESVQVDTEVIVGMAVPDILIENALRLACERNIIVAEDGALFGAKLMGMLTPMPSAVAERFDEIKTFESADAACKDFYNLCIKNNYIQKTAIDKNKYWKADFGDTYLEVTINLSKPEKSNADTAKLLSVKDSGYPKCVLCRENLGYKGDLKKAARQNLRIIPMKLGREDWFMQYSPYSYYDEHCIVISNEHRPMKVDSTSIPRLVDFVNVLPNYFLGSNASLPIIGGSILNHEHYQGGLHLMPMHNANARVKYKARVFPRVEISELNWYNNVIRLESADSSAIVECGNHIISTWADFDSAKSGFKAHTIKQHNAVSPIIRKVGDKYSLDIILRNNCTSEALPDGIFHAHPKYHNIKKESIGLIEAMGMFILPGRLESELKAVGEYLSGKKFDKANPAPNMTVHSDMIEELLSLHGRTCTVEQADAHIRAHINKVCQDILRCTAVFKADETGWEEFARLMSTLNFERA